MNLIDRYVSEIARRLPKRQREDVRRELRSALGDALESRVEGEPTEDQVVELLREWGSPETVASSYQPGRGYLIGPSLFPTFKTVTSVVLVVLASLVAVGFAIDLAVDPPQGKDALFWPLRLLSGLWESVLSAFAIVVLIFAVLERFAGDEPEEDEWDPRDLPEGRDDALVGRGEALLGIVLPLAFLVLMNLFKDHFGVIVHPGGEVLLNDVFQDCLPWLNLALLLGIALNAWLLRTGRWQWPTRLFGWAIDVYWIWILFEMAGEVTVREGTLVTAGVPETAAGMIVRLADLVPWFVTLLVVWSVVKVAYRSLRSGGAAATAGRA